MFDSNEKKVKEVPLKAGFYLLTMLFLVIMLGNSES